MKKLLLIILFTMLPVIAHGATYYVAKTGNDSNSCSRAQSLSTPKSTINAGAACLSSGDTLLVAAGTYAEQLQNVVPSGTASKPTLVQAKAGDTVTIKPPVIRGHTTAVLFKDKHYITFDGFIVDATNIFNVALSITGTSTHIVIQNCTIQNMAGNPTDSNGGAGISLYRGGGGFNTIRNNTIRNIGVLGGASDLVHGIYGKSTDNLIENNIIYNNGSHGIHIYDGSAIAHRNIVRGNMIYNNRTRGILLSAGDANRAYNNIVYKNGAQGIQIGGYGGPTTNTHVYNNTLYANGEGIRVGSQYRGPSGTIVRNNIAWQHPSDAIRRLNDTATTVDHNLLGTNPLFVNQAAADFHLQPGSPAIDAGVVISGRLYNGSAPDLGALELVFNIPTVKNLRIVGY